MHEFRHRPAQRRVTVPRRVISFALALLSAGCGGERGPELYPVQGTVTFDGTPVESGNIIFHSSDGSAESHASKIEDGAFSFRTTAGTKHVQINATREVPGETRLGADDAPVPVREQYIPARYNSPQSELTVTVDPKAENAFTLQLQSE